MLNLLRKIAQEVNSAEDLNSALDLVVGSVKEHMKVEVCSVFLWDTNIRRYVLMATNGLNKSAVGQVSLGASEGIVALAGKREEPINLEDANAHPSFHFVPGIGEESFKAFLAVPIIHHRKLLGVLSVQNKNIRRFDESEEAFLVTISAQLAGTIAHGEATGVIEGNTIFGEKTENSRFEGVAGASGVAIGPAYVIAPPADLDSVINKTTDNIEFEEQAFIAALELVRGDINRAGEKLASDLRPEEQALFDVYIGMLEDHALGGEVVKKIRGGQWAQGALCQVIREYSLHFAAMEDPYLKERGTDIRDLGRRILGYLQKDDVKGKLIPLGSIVVGEEMTPAILGELVGRDVVGIVSTMGSANSHIAILARAMGIPTVMGVVDLPFRSVEGMELVVDGYRGHVYSNLTEDKRQFFAKIVEDEKEIVAGLESLKDLPAQTTDGYRISLVVNTGLMTDVLRSQNKGAEGVGLYRTEVPFMMRERFPSEAEQAAIYREQLEAFAPLPVTMRTLDIGGDKSLPYFPIKEDNPFLGWRGIRVTLDHPEIFLVQVRAMLRASEGLDNLSIMLPMITSVNELEEAQHLIYRAVHELNEEGLDVKMPPVGVMIEVPAAVYQTAELAARSDFISVGTNDLTQYLLAVDRNNPRVADLYSSYHPAVLMALQFIATQAHKSNTPVSVCGEIAGDPIGAILLMGMGYQQLSMNAASLLQVKSIVREISYEWTQDLLNSVKNLDNAMLVKSSVEFAVKKKGLLLSRLGVFHD